MDKLHRTELERTFIYLRFQQVKGSMIFNDDFLEEEYTNLPHYEGTEMLPVRHGVRL